MDEHITIRRLETLDEFRACHDVQTEAWQFPDRLIIPYTQLVSAQHNGGLVLGAFDGATLVGFVYGYLGRRGDRPLYLFSQRMGVQPGHQGRGVGEGLKWAQRAWALEQGLTRVLWTYDPLEAPNAWLNLVKLGGVVRRYERDFYGQHETPLHDRLPTDRFVVEWDLLDERVADRASADRALPTAEDLLARAGAALNPVSWDEQGLPRSAPPDLTRRGATLAAEVPAAWQALRRADIDLARDWRRQTRRLFEHYLARGYAVTGYAREPKGERRRNVYFLERQA